MAIVKKVVEFVDADCVYDGARDTEPKGFTVPKKGLSPRWVNSGQVGDITTDQLLPRYPFLGNGSTVELSRRH